MPKAIGSMLPYFYKKAQTVLTAYEFDLDDDNNFETLYVANNEDIGSYTALSIKRGTITTEEGTVLNEIEIGLDNTDLEFKNYILNGSFERKKCQIKLLFVSPAKAILGYVVVHWGLLDAPKGDENWITFTIRPMTQLEREFPRRIYQVGCNWRFCKDGCQESLGNWDYEGTLSADSDGSTLSISHGQAVNYFVPGYAKITDGDYEGEVRPIVTNSTSNVIMRVSFGHTIPSGTGIFLQKLCAKNPDVCENNFNQYENYGGFPHVPKQPII